MLNFLLKRLILKFQFLTILITELITHL